MPEVNVEVFLLKQKKRIEKEQKKIESNEEYAKIYDSLLVFVKEEIESNIDIIYREYETSFTKLSDHANKVLKKIQDFHKKDIEEHKSLSLDESRVESDIDFVDYFQKFIEDLEPAVNDSFDTLYFLSIFTRMANKLIYWLKLTDGYVPDDKNKHYFTHIQNIYYLTTRIPKDKYDEILKATMELFDIEIKKNKFNWNKQETIKVNTGIIHCVADVVVTIYEECILLHDHDFLKKHKLDFKRNHILSNVMKELEKIVNEQERNGNPYGKFFCTYARLQAYSEDNILPSSISFQKALNYEDTTREDYNNRISYIREKRQTSNLVLNQHTSFMNLNKINENTKELDKRISNSLMKNLEFMGLFAGLIGFMIVSINVSSMVDYEYALQLLTVAFLSIILTFTTIDLVINNKTPKKHYISYVVLFATLFLIGFLLNNL